MYMLYSYDSWLFTEMRRLSAFASKSETRAQRLQKQDFGQICLFRWIFGWTQADESPASNFIY